MSSKITSIQVLGSGCPTCKKLFELTKDALSQLNLEVEAEYVNDIQKIIETGLMSSPVLTINGKVVLAGQLPSLNKIKEIIFSYKQEDLSQSNGGCSCGVKC